MVLFFGNFEVEGIKNLNSTKFIFIVVFVFSSIRVGIGYDYYQYIRLIKQSIIDYDSVRIEFLADLLMRLSYHISFYQLFFIITSFIIAFSLYRGISILSTNPSLSFISFIFIPFLFLESLSTIRSSVALSLCFLSFAYFYTKRYFLSFLFFFFAIGFHISAIVSLLIPFVFSHIYKPQFRTQLILYVSSFFLGIFVYNYLSSIVDFFPYDIKKYILSFNIKGSGHIMAIVINLINILNFIFYKKLKNIADANEIYIRIYNIGTICWNVLFFQDTIRLRVSLFYLIYIILLIPSYLYVFNYRNRNILKIVINIFLILFLSSSFYINISAHLSDRGKISFLPYQTIFHYKVYPLYLK